MTFLKKIPKFEKIFTKILSYFKILKKYIFKNFNLQIHDFSIFFKKNHAS